MPGERWMITRNEAVEMYARFWAAHYGRAGSKLARETASLLETKGDLEGYKIWDDVANAVSGIAHQEIRDMRMLTLAPPSATATVSRCPQCGAVMRIKIIEPDLKKPSKAWHVFECEECSLPRTYFIEAA